MLHRARFVAVVALLAGCEIADTDPDIDSLTFTSGGDGSTGVPTTTTLPGEGSSTGVAPGTGSSTTGLTTDGPATSSSSSDGGMTGSSSSSSDGGMTGSSSSSSDGGMTDSSSSSSDDGDTSSTSSGGESSTGMLTSSTGMASTGSTGDADSGSTGGLACGMDVCGPDEACLGQACSCIQAIHGNTVLRTDGTVVNYQFGTWDIEEGATGLPLTGITEIFEGQHHGCGLRDDGTVWCWGKVANGNNSGQMGDGTVGGVLVPWQAQPVMLSPADGGGMLTGVVHLNSGESRCYIAATTCAIRNDGTVWCWGSGGNEGGGPGYFNDGVIGVHEWPTQMLADPVTPLDAVDAISIGIRHMCTLRGTEVWCWGMNVGGPLGQGDQMTQTYPVLVPLPGAATHVHAGSDVSCARVADGMYCWGANNSGQVGVGDPAANTDGCINFCVLQPEQVLDDLGMPLTGVVDANAAYLANCVIRDLPGDPLWCWGANQSNVATPLSVIGAPVTDVAMQTSCSSGDIDTAIRYLTTSDELYAASQLVAQTCN